MHFKELVIYLIRIILEKNNNLIFTFLNYPIKAINLNETCKKSKDNCHYRYPDIIYPVFSRRIKAQ